jgi:hypothetical protein
MGRRSRDWFTITQKRCLSQVQANLSLRNIGVFAKIFQAISADRTDERFGIPIQSGWVFRCEAGHGDETKPAAIPI